PSARASQGRAHARALPPARRNGAKAPPGVTREEGPGRSPPNTFPTDLNRRFSLVGTVVAVANQKGGVGKTTTAVNLGASIADAGYPTLLVDLDPQCNATVALGLPKDGGGSV